MANDATVKDVLYALEYMHAQLVRRPANKPGSKCSWVLEPTGQGVKEKVAEQARSHVAVVSIAERNGEVRYMWRRAAA